MGRSNRTAALESKISLLLGEHDTKRIEIEKAERFALALPAMRERLWEIETLLEACEAIIKSDQPNWTRDHLKPLKPFVHKIPVRLGSAIKVALDLLRVADEPMTGRELAIEVLRREGHDNPDTDTITKVANTIGAGLRSARERGTVDRDTSWPARWWAVRPNKSGVESH